MYWVSFIDKDGNGYEVSRPEEFLSERSVSRRAWQGLAVDETDLPVTGAYVEEIRSMGLEIAHVSRWLNGLLLVNASREDFEAVLELPFTDTLPWSAADDGEKYYPPLPGGGGSRFGAALPDGADFDYGVAREQVTQVHTDYLHRRGFTGQGVWIGVLDAGFRNVDSLPSFTAMREEERLLDTRNFVSDSSLYRLINSHGMYVLSIMGGLWEGNMVGTAPHASYILCSTEDVHSETRIEEVNWIAGAEYLDSLGADVFNTSLGYSDFDGTAYDHSYADMDGQSTLISRASSMLADKGIISCTSAGNEGNKPWYRITAPSDAHRILCVGAADSLGTIASFSSRGPSFDGRVKPEITAMGRATGIQYVNGNLARGSGTSFSSPVAAGSVACLWQAWPTIPAAELITIIRNTGDRFQNPDATYGYGIPSFAWAFNIISSAPPVPEALSFSFYPNPAGSWIHINLSGEAPGLYNITILDQGGRVVHRDRTGLPGRYELPAGLAPGFHILEISSGERMYRNKLIIR